MSLIGIETRIIDNPIIANKKQIYPISKSIHLNAPGINGGIIWNWPSAVLVVNEDGSKQTVAIPDPTKSAILSLISLGGLLLVLGWLILHKRT